MRQARFEIDAIRTGNVVSAMWQDEEALSAVNIAMDKSARLLRLSGSDILTTTMRSTDGASVFLRETYSPSISLTIAVDQTDYFLPENFVSMVSIRPITSGFEGIRFRPTSNENPTFLTMRNIPTSQLASANNGEAEFWYTIVGSRTLRLAPAPKDAFGIEVVYHYRPAKLRYVNNGTVQRTNGLVGVTGSSTTWLTDGVRHPADLLVGVTTTSGVDLSTSYPTTGSTILSDTTLALARASTTTDGAGQAYFLAGVPRLPEEHHTWLAQLVGAIMLRKVDVDLSNKLQGDLAAELLTAITPEVTLRQMQESLITEAFGLPI